MGIRARWIAVAALAVALVLPASAGGWHYTFQDFFNAQGGSFSSGRATAKKCGGGGKLGTYDYRSFAQAGGGDTEIAFEILADLSVRHHFEKMKRVEVTYEHSPDIPEDVAAEAAGALAEFHETVFTKFREAGDPDKLLVRHGSLVMFGREVVEPGHTKTKFDPKPGC